jgi:hypothetical protein
MHSFWPLKCAALLDFFVAVFRCCHEVYYTRLLLPYQRALFDMSQFLGKL